MFIDATPCLYSRSCRYAIIAAIITVADAAHAGKHIIAADTRHATRLALHIAWHASASRNGYGVIAGAGDAAL